MSKVDDAIVEINLALSAMAPVHEGLRDFSRLNLEAEARVVVQSELERYDTRKILLERGLEALIALVGDGYPTLVIPAVTETVLNDLRANASTIEAALTQFTSNAAGNLGLSGSEPELK